METKIPENGVSNDVLILTDIKDIAQADIIKRTIEKHGFSPEHNYEYLCAHDSEESKPYFVSFGGYRGLLGVRWDDGVWQVISEVMAPEDERCGLLLKFLNYVIGHESCKKFLVEFSPQMRSELLSSLKDMKKEKGHYPITVGKIISRYYTPLVSLKEWSPSLEGSSFSNLRKCRNRYYRNFKIEIVRMDAANAVPYDAYEKLVHAWRKGRKAKDTAYYDDYLYFFRNGFAGSDVHLAILIDGILRGVAAGWEVPNSVHRTLYYGVNLHDYSIPELGDFLTMTFLDELKSRGYEYMDFGSSDENLLKYKKKFGISSQYETVAFYIRPSMPSI